MRLCFIAIFICLFQKSFTQEISNKNTNLDNGLCSIAAKVNSNIKIGTNFNPKIFTNEIDKLKSLEIIRREFNIVSISTNMPTIQKRQGIFTFDRTDELVNFASENKIGIWLQPLIADNKHTADWIVEGNYSAADLAIIMRIWIEKIINRYKDKIVYVNVVNEALLGLDNSDEFKWKTENNVWMNMGWYQGKHHRFPQYLIEAFKIAREIGGPSIQYIYNQWGNATTDSKMGDACYKLYFALKEEGILLDGMGIQLHCALKKGKLFEQPGGENQEFNFSSYGKLLNRYKEKKINLHITEFDIALSENPSSEELEKQGKYYAEVMKYSLLSSAVKTFKFWGISDKYSWIRHSLPYQASPLLYDTNFNPKPALLYLKYMLHNELKVSNH